MRRLLVALVLAPALAFGASQAYLWYKVKNAADDIAAAVAPVLELKYTGIHASLRGEVGLKGLTLRPRGIGDEIRVQAVLFRAEDLTSLLAIDEQLRAGQLPRTAALSIVGLEVDTDGALADMLSTFANASANQPLMPLEGCGGQPVGLRELGLMGYDEVSTDIRMSYEMLSANRLTMNFSADTRQMARIDVDLSMSGDGLDRGIRELATAHPRLERVALRYVDEGYNQRMMGLCRSRSGLSEQAAIDQQLELVRFLLVELGVDPSEPIMQALGRFFQSSGSIRLVMNPADPLTPDGLQHYTPDQVIRMLQPELTINGQSLTISPLDEQQRLAALGARERSHPPTASRDSADERPRYRVVALSALPGQVGWPVRLKLRSGNVVDGHLEAIEGSNLVLERRIARGSYSYPIPLADIAGAEVYR
jgi:hypothetical protein